MLRFQTLNSLNKNTVVDFNVSPLIEKYLTDIARGQRVPVSDKSPGSV